MILLGQPSYGDIKPGTCNDWQQLIQPADVTCIPCPMIGTNVVEARCRIAEAALSWLGVTHVLWIDSDMRFPCDTLTRLLAHDLDMVAANCRSRQPPYTHSARINGTAVQPSSGLQTVDVVGFGIVLTTTRMIRETLRTQGDPLFLHEWVGRVDGRPTYRSEDFYFCTKARQAGFDIWIDHDLSAQCRHITERELSYAEV